MNTGDEKFYEKILASIGDGLYVADSCGEIIWVNEALTLMLGVGEDELLGTPAAGLLAGPSRNADGTVGGGLAPGFHETFLDECRRRDGTLFPVEIRLSALQEAGGTVGALRDIAERRSADRALRAAEQKYRDLADSLPQTVFEADPDGVLSFINKNACEAFGYSAEELAPGFNAFDLLVPEQRLGARENLKRFIDGQQHSGNEYCALRKDGTTFPVLIHAARIQGPHGVTGVRGFMIDIEDRKKIDEELLKARRLQSIASLAGGVAEDFNTILLAVLGNINIAQHHAADNTDIAGPLVAAERAALRARDATEQLRMFSRGGSFSKAPLLIDAMLREACEYALKGSPLQVVFELAPDLWTVNADASQIRQVCINLIINADHAMPDGGCLTVAAKNMMIGAADNLTLRDGPYVRIAIRDQSIGILNEHVQHIFEPYFTARRRGSGVGLATAYIVARNHEGLIVAESEFGRGTTFYLYLPAEKNKKD